MNIAVVFAGGTGQRMNTKTLPKQFLELHGKPIIIYTLEKFEQSPDVDSIIVVCHPDWILYFKSLLERFRISKIAAIVDGGKNGQESIYNGIKKASDLYDMNSIVLIHDGVRPLIDIETINKDIITTKEYGSAITVSKANETITLSEDQNAIDNIIAREYCWIAKAPQCFILGQLLEAHEKAISEGLFNFIDSASLMKYYGYSLHMVIGRPDNIKITTPSDFYIFRAILDAQENSQIFG